MKAFIAAEGDSRSIMGLVDEAVADPDRFWVVSQISGDDSWLPENKRFIRQALFSAECLVVLFRDDQGCFGFMVLADEVVSALQSKSLLLLVLRKEGESVLESKMLDSVGLKKIRCTSVAENELVERLGFTLEGVMELATAKNYFYSLSAGGSRRC